MSRRLEAVVVAATLFVAGTATGATWTRGDLPFERVFEVVAHPTLPAIAFAATSSGVYRTTAAGSHWQRVSELSLMAFAFNPFRDVEVCALVDGFRAPASHAAGYCSVDLGLTWLPMPSAGISFLLFDRGVPDRMYSGVGYGNQWIYVSNDHGKTWELNGYTSELSRLGGERSRVGGLRDIMAARRHTVLLLDATGLSKPRQWEHVGVDRRRTDSMDRHHRPLTTFDALLRVG